MYDVIVVGAGPAGSIAARKCAQAGLKTLLLEKKTLPRDKLCSGMVMGRMAQETIQEEFGPVPDSVLTTPAYLRGIMAHAPGVEPEVVEQKMPYAWRRDLDFWMTQKAKEAGAEVRDGARVTAVEPNGTRCTVKLAEETLESRFVIGADGSRSTVRKLAYPKLKVVCRTSYRECYPGELALDRNYFHWIFPLSRARPRFDLNHKGEFFLLEGAVKELKSDIVKFLRPHGFSADQRPKWKEACATGALPTDGLFTGSFVPAQGNILLVGDAAMLQLPASGEGIGMALKSGLLAARSIVEAAASKRDVAPVYLGHFASLLTVLKELSLWNQKLEEAGKRGPKALVIAFADALRATLKVT